MTCAKLTVDCWIVAESGDVFHGRNAVDAPQPHCPRLQGEGYDKCKTVCQQHGHAEEQALRNAGTHNLQGSTAYIQGHSHFCENCQKLLFAAGIKFLTIGKPNI